MTVHVLCFFQPGCMGCMEQEPINREVEKALGLKIEEINAVEDPESIKKYSLTVTPTILVLTDEAVRERFEGVVFPEQLKDAIRKYL